MLSKTEARKYIYIYVKLYTLGVCVRVCVCVSVVRIPISTPRYKKKRKLCYVRVSRYTHHHPTRARVYNDNEIIILIIIIIIIIIFTTEEEEGDEEQEDEWDRNSAVARGTIYDMVHIYGELRRILFLVACNNVCGRRVRAMR